MGFIAKGHFLIYGWNDGKRNGNWISPQPMNNVHELCGWAILVNTFTRERRRKWIIKERK